MNSLYDTIKTQAIFNNEDIGTSAEESTYVQVDPDHTVLLVAEIITINDVFDLLKVVQATDSGGSGKKDVAGAAITDFSKFALVGAKALLEVETGALDVAGGFNFVALSMKTTGAGGVDAITGWSLINARFNHSELNTPDFATNVKKV